MSEQFLAEAQIVVTPDTKGFRTQLIQGLNSAKRGVKVEVLVVPDMTGFRTELIAAVKRSTTNVVARVAVRPDLTGFRAAAAGGAARSTRNLTTEIRASAARGAAAGAPAAVTTTAGTAGAVAGTAKLTAAEKALADATNQAAFARKRLGTSLTTEERLTARLDREKLALASAEKAYTTALREQNSALAIQSNELRKATAAQVARTEAQLAAPAQADAARQARDAERAARATQRAGAAQARLLTANAALAAKAQGPALAENAARDRLAKELTISEQKRALAARQLAEAEQIEDNIGKKLIATRQGLRTASAGVVAAEEALTAATETGNQALIERATLELNAAKAAKTNAAANLQAAEAERLRLGRFGAAKQGLLASIAQLTGLRGAALTANAAFIAAAAGVTLFAKSVKSAADFASELKVFQVTAGATATEMGKVGAKAQALGRDITLPGVAASDAATAMTELAKAGLSVQDSMDAARGVLQLATAAQIDNAQATNLTASALNAFGLAGDQAVHVADVLANSANDSQGSITDMGIALQQSAAVGRQAGLTLEQTTAALTILARAGLRGSDAGTSLRTALIRLINPTKKAQEQIQDLGLHLRTAQGNINLNVFDEFAQKTKEMSKAQRDQALAVIFGQDAIRAAAILARTGKADLDAQIDSLNKTGTAADVAAARMTGLSGAGANLLNQLQTLGLTIGGLATGPLAALADAFADNLKFANKLITLLKDLPSEIPFPDIKVGPIDTNKQGKDFGQKVAGGIKAGLSVALKGAVTDALFPAAGLVPGGGPGLIFLLNRLFPEKTIDEKARAVRKSVDGIVATFRQAGSDQSGLNLNVALTSLDALADKLETGDADSQKLAESVRQVRKQLANPTIISGFKIAPIKIPDDLKRGDAGKEIGAATLKGFEEGLPPNKLFGLGAFATRALADGIAAGKGDIGAAVNGVVDFMQNALQTAINKSAKRVTKRQTGQQSGLEEAFNDILIGGGSPAAQVANLREQEKRQQTIIDANTGAAEAQVKARRAAKDKLAQIVGQIKSIQDQQTSDAKQAAQDIKTKQDAADQAVLDAFLPAERKLELRQGAAENTNAPRLILQVAQARKVQLVKEIKIIGDTVKNQQTAATEIHSRRVAIEALDGEIKSDILAIAQPSEALQARIDLAESSGNIPLLVKLIHVQIKNINQAIAAGNLGAAAVNKLKLQRRQFQKEAADAITDRFAKQLQLAQITGNKDAILAAFNKAIADAKRRVKFWKKLGLVQIDEKLSLAQLVKDRKDFLKDLQDAQGDNGLTIAEFLTQNNDLFKSIAGNIGTVGKDPFSGFDFSGSIVKTLTRLQSAAPGSAGGRTNTLPTLTPGVRTGIGGGLDTSLERLIKALDRNTDAKDGNTSTGVGLNADARNEVKSRFPSGNRFWENRLARQQVEDNI